MASSQTVKIHVRLIPEREKIGGCIDGSDGNTAESRSFHTTGTQEEAGIHRIDRGLKNKKNDADITPPPIETRQIRLRAHKN